MIPSRVISNFGAPMRTSCKSRRRACARLFPAVLFAAGLFSGCGSARKAAGDDLANAPTAAIVKAQRRNLSSQLNISSEFQPYQEVNVYAKVSGYIQKLDVNWGTHVKQGQSLAVLEIPELQQQLQQDEANTKKSEQDLDRAKEELNRAQSAYTVAHLTYSRLADVQKSRPELMAQEEIDIAQGKDLEASAGESSAKDALAGSAQELVASRAALEKDRAMYAYSRITAPFEGVVTEIDAYTGALLPAGTSSNKGDQALCHLSQNNLLRLVIPVPERAVADIRVGEDITVRVSAINKTFEGKISLFSDQIDRETRTMHTEVTVPNPKYEVVPGMYATVQIPLHTVQNALTVSVQAVQSSDETHGSVLVVGGDNRIEKRDVTLGLENASDVEILSGLSDNDRVVFGEQSQFKPGELVNPKAVTPSEVE
jgi:RND family efflux transporter MFP subunit